MIGEPQALESSMKVDIGLNPLPADYREFGKPKYPALGEGSYGAVYIYRNKAIKKADSDYDGINQTTIREVMALKNLRHINVIR
jgi:hypothetical protein